MTIAIMLPSLVYLLGVIISCWLADPPYDLTEDEVVE